MGWIILAIVLLLVIAIISMYNSLVSSRIKVDNAWSQIDVQLQRRFDLIPNFVETVKGYASHESETFEKIAKLRTSWANAGTVAEKANLDNQLSSALKTIMAVSNIIANMFNFKPRDLFKTDSDEARKNVKVDFGKNS